MKILFDFNAKVGREDIFKPITGNESSDETRNDNGITVVNFATPMLSSVQCSHIAKFINTLGLLLMEKHTIRLITTMTVFWDGETRTLITTMNVF
jgi:hypothetical protein